MIRWTLRVVYGLIILSLLLFIFLITPPGLRVGFSILQKTLPGQLKAEQLNGTLFGPISIYKLTYEDKSVEVKVRDLYLNWHLTSLWTGKININDLRVNKLKITYKKNKTHADNPNPEPLKIPLGIFIEKAYINRIAIYNPDHRVALFSYLKVNNFSVNKNNLNGLLTFELKEPYPIFNEITLNGTLENYQLNWKLRYAKETFFIKGQGTERSLNIDLNNNRLFTGTIDGQINLIWYPELHWQSNIKISHLNLKLLDPKLPNINSILVDSKGVWQNKWPTFNINAEIHAPQVKVNIKGQHTHEWDLQWTADIKKLSYLFPSYKGAIQSNGTLQGNYQNPKINARFHAENIEVKQNKAQLIDGTVHIDSAMLEPSQLNLRASNVVTAYFQADQLSVQASATQNLNTIKGAITLQNSQGTTTINTELNGKLTNAGWQGAVTQFSIKPGQSAEWKLEKPSAITIFANKVIIQQACLRATLGYACIDVTWNATQPWKIVATGHFPNVNFITSLLSPQFTITAPADFKAEIDGDGSKIKSVTAQLTSNSGNFIFTHGTTKYTLPLQKLNIEATSKNNDLYTKILVQLSESDVIRAEARLPNFINNIKNLERQPILGSINVDISQLSLLEQFIPYIAQPSGRLQGQLKISGRFPLPEVKGNLAIQHGNILIPNAKIALHDVILNIGAQDNKLIYNVAATSQTQGIKITGSTSYVKGKLITEFHLTGTNVLVMNTPEYVVYASPDLTIRIIDNTITVTGQIFIPKAIIKPADFSSTVSLSDDTVIIYPQKVVTSEPYQIAINIEVVLGDEVTIDTTGLKGEVHGKLQIVKTTDQPFPTANGQLTLNNATFIAKGKTLKIVPGSGVNYLHDSLTNPHLNIRAARTVSVAATQSTSSLGPTPTEVGVDIKGTFKRPEVSLFSSPIGLSQADILSYLIFDQPASGATSALTNYSVLFQAFSFLKLSKKGEGSSINQIKQSLGISELGIEEQFTVDALGTPLGINQSAFVIGSYLSPHIYFRFSRTLSSPPINIYQIRYIINPHWAIQTEIGPSISGVGSGLDILYTISKKKFPY